VLLIASGALLAVLVIRNPFLVDSVPLALLAFMVVPGVLGAIIGLVVGGVVATRSRRRPPRGNASWQRRLFLIGLGLVVAVSLLGRLASARAERGPKDPPVRLMLIGIDGATWSVAGPMMSRGELSNLASFVERGASGILTSLEPMYSPRIFTSIVTGKNADKHGVRTTRDITANAVVVKRLWDILADQLGWEYGLVEWYLTWPPAASPRGFTIPGILAQSYDTIPPELSFIKKLRAQSKDTDARAVRFYWGILSDGVTSGLRLSTIRELFDLGLARRRGATPREMYGAQQQAVVRVLTDVTCCQLRRRPVETLALVYKSTDSVSHRYWAYHEPSRFSNLSNDEVERFGGMIEETYAIVDRELARLERYVSPDGVMAILSDHGFQAKRGLDYGFFSLRTKTLLEKMGFSLGEVSYVNVGGKAVIQPLTLDERESARIRGELAAAFGSVTIEGDGREAFRVTDVDREGTGDDYVEVYITRLLEESASNGASLLTQDGRSIPIEDFFQVLDVSGAHAPDGLIVLVGEPFRAGASPTGASILDVTPTLLAAVGLPVAEDMDGRPLVEVMSPEYLSRAPIAAAETYETGERVPQRIPSDDAVPEDVKERLRSLGYIE
jgi:predicted AlkP superfamily phosphohydrolase/phosphomutase